MWLLPAFKSHFLYSLGVRTKPCIIIFLQAIVPMSYKRLFLTFLICFLQKPETCSWQGAGMYFNVLNSYMGQFVGITWHFLLPTFNSFEISKSNFCYELADSVWGSPGQGRIGPFQSGCLKYQHITRGIYILYNRCTVQVRCLVYLK